MGKVLYQKGGRVVHTICKHRKVDVVSLVFFFFFSSNFDVSLTSDETILITSV